jgi:glycosyltransferase involved in cell wall biosynthesis
MLHGRNIVCVSTIDWSFLWQEHQGVMSVLADAGNRVLFVENTGVRAPGWRDARRVATRLRTWLSGRGRFGEVAENITLYSPLALPLPYSPLAQRFNRTLVCGSIRRWLERNRFDDPLLFTFLPTQFTLDLIDAIAPRLSIFYCTDKLSETSVAARRVLPYEQRLLERCDLVFASSQRLVEYCSLHNRDVHLFPIGVSLEKFERAWRGETPSPVDVAALPRPRIGFVGGLRNCMDQPLVRRLSEHMPQASLIFIGPEQAPMDELRRLRNTHLLGTRPHERVPDYLRAFDACIIPYAVDDFTNNISPAKLNEYLALGKPVIATDLAEIRRFNETYGGVVNVATTPAEFCAEMERAIREDSADLQRNRRAVAEQNSWQGRVERMSELIERRLQERSTPPAAAVAGR